MYRVGNCPNQSGYFLDEIICVLGDDFLTSSNQSYSNQNLYVQPPTRNPNLNQNGSSFDEKADPMSGTQDHYILSVVSR